MTLAFLLCVFYQSLTKYEDIRLNFMNIHQPIIVTVSFPDKDIAQLIAKQLIEKKLIACAQIFAIESIYQWQGQLENSQEYLMQAKTIHTLWRAIQDHVKESHPYDVPEIIATPMIEVDEHYFQWMLAELGFTGQQLYV